MSGPLRSLRPESGAERQSDLTDNLVTGTSMARLARAFRSPPERGDEPTFGESVATVVGGIANPYGSSLSAYEPNTVLFADYAKAFGASQASKQGEEAAGAELVTGDFTRGAGPAGPTTQADGQVKSMISAAMDLASRRVPYVWGGTTRNGVDCSGLIYYAAKAAGINLPRLRAIDYGKMGTQVSADQARPGDLVYWDNPNTTTDHIGIYLGNGKVVQAPTTGDVVKVSNVWQNPPPTYRRVFEDSAFQAVNTPTGVPATSYGGRTYAPANRLSSPSGARQPAPAKPTVRRTYDRRLLR